MPIHRAIQGILLLALLGADLARAATNGIAQQEGFPFHGKTTSRVNGRLEGKIVKTFEKGELVYVVGQDGPEWYIVGVRHRYRVAAAYIQRVTADPRPMNPPKPVLGIRMFYVITDSYREVGGQRYPWLTAFDMLRQDETTATIVGFEGHEVVIKKDSMRLAGVPWDYGRDAPVPDSENLLQRYNHSFATMLTHWWFFAALFLLLAGYAWLAVLGRDSEIRDTFLLALFTLLGLLLVGAEVGRAQLRYLQVYENTAAWIAPYRLANGYFLPLSYKTVDPTDSAEWARGMWYSLTIVIWVPCFLAAHVLLLYYLPSAVRGAHFFFVRHPAEKHVTVRGPVGQLTRNIKGALQAQQHKKWRWMPLFVLRNYERRLRRKEAYLKAERELLEQAIEVDRKKAEFEDRRRRNG